MVIIIRFGLKPTEFGLGRILWIEEAMTMTLETYVPSGDRSRLFFSILSDSPADRATFVERVRKHQRAS